MKTKADLQLELVARINARYEIADLLSAKFHARLRELEKMFEKASNLEERECVDARIREVGEFYFMECEELSAYSSSILAKMDELNNQEEGI